MQEIINHFKNKTFAMKVITKVQESKKSLRRKVDYKILKKVK